MFRILFGINLLLFLTACIDLYIALINKFYTQNEFIFAVFGIIIVMTASTNILISIKNKGENK